MEPFRYFHVSYEVDFDLYIFNLFVKKSVMMM